MVKYWSTVHLAGYKLYEIILTWLPVAPSMEDVLTPVFPVAILPWCLSFIPFTSETVLVLRLDTTEVVCGTVVPPAVNRVSGAQSVVS